MCLTDKVMMMKGLIVATFRLYELARNGSYGLHADAGDRQKRSAEAGRTSDDVASSVRRRRQQQQQHQRLRRSRTGTDGQRIYFS